MITFEYMKLDLNTLRGRESELDILNRAGSQGWELVSISQINVAILKRPADTGARDMRYAPAHAGAAPEKHMVQAAAASGHTADEAHGDEAESRDKRSTVAVKYRDPNNPENTWTGRGRMPRWLAEAIATGGASKDDYLV